MKTLTRSTLGTLAVLLGIGLPSAALAQTHVDNPFVGATVYKNPDYATKVQTSIAQTADTALKSKMQIVAQTPTFIWLDRIAAIAAMRSSQMNVGVCATICIFDFSAVSAVCAIDVCTFVA